MLEKYQVFPLGPTKKTELKAGSKTEGNLGRLAAGCNRPGSAGLPDEGTAVHSNGRRPL